jgi:hypothetical protein
VQAERLVKVARGGWVDGDEGDVGAVRDCGRRRLRGQPDGDASRCLIRLALRRERELCR